MVVWDESMCDCFCGGEKEYAQGAPKEYARALCIPNNTFPTTHFHATIHLVCTRPIQGGQDS